MFSPSFRHIDVCIAMFTAHHVVHTVVEIVSSCASIKKPEGSSEVVSFKYIYYLMTVQVHAGHTLLF